MNTSPEQQETRIHFETPHVLHSLFANDVKELKYLENALAVKAVTRDGWVHLSGHHDAVQKAQLVFSELDNMRRAGGEIAAREFRMAVDAAAAGEQISLSDLTKVKLLGSRKRKPVSARSPQQVRYIDAMTSNDVVFGLGPAGTGKTYLAMAMALSLLRARQISRIILTRPAVEAGEALGFLPGDLQEKVAPYLRPLYDALHDMVDPDEAERYLEDGTIEIAPLAYMRGRTLSRAFVILDEAQNTTCEQMFMLLTRIGEASRLVVTGDSSQVDLKANQQSGLAEAERALQNIDDIEFIRFSGKDVVRHPIVGKIIAAYEHERAR
ncbi:PhoH family protein [Persicirhabdus sediminis]|uniref:PhoH-like protein n=1 Tax=Persicirhabdus sediminis TaxID=454144 RepID=A0A8J7SKN8_9BACT|nr:PhoH family protein [Persicirhabdus sediminis]MBK1790900.1 PhoH family protein [Persicirhabdus sediminis]